MMGAKRKISERRLLTASYGEYSSKSLPAGERGGASFHRVRTHAASRAAMWQDTFQRRIIFLGLITDEEHLEQRT